MRNETYEVAIVGGGIIGCSIAWELLRRDCRVTLLDTYKELFQGSSSAGFGSLTPYSDPFFVGDAREFAASGVDLYRSNWIAELRRETQEEIPVGPEGLIELFDTAEAFDDAFNFVSDLNAARPNTARILSVRDVQALEPALAGEYRGGVWFDEPWLDKAIYFRSLGRAVKKRIGAALRIETTVNRIVPDGDVYRLESEDTFIARSTRVVICTGLLGVPIQGVAALDLPLAWVRGDAIGVHTKDDVPLLSRHVYMGNGFITPRKNGYMLLGATYVQERAPMQDPTPARDRIGLRDFEELINFNERILPGLKDCEVSHVWRGWRPTAPDKMPMLGPISGHPNIIVANGFIGLGITMAPAVARTIADYFLNDINKFPQAFDPNRFFNA